MHYFVFDVESVGLFGPSFGVAYVVVKDDGTELHSGVAWTTVGEALRSMSPIQRVSAGDIEWVETNISIPEIDPLLPSKGRLLDTFWGWWEEALSIWPGIQMVADCQFPVEANFLLDVCHHVNVTISNSPYPVLDVNSALLAAGLDPLGTYERRPNETPEHHPLGDSRQSARMFIEALNETKADREACRR
jgi:hypothetical protein